jgi:hypothetical protein
MPGEPPKNVQNDIWLKIHPANLIRLAYWRRRIISANTIGFGEGVALQKICIALSVRQDNDYYLSCSKRKGKYGILQRNDTFICQITLDRHNVRLKLSYCLFPESPTFSFLSTFKINETTRYAE